MNSYKEQNFLDKIFSFLKPKSTKSNTPNNSNLTISSVYEGFMTIPIQKLNSKSHPKGGMSGKDLWNQYPTKNILYYEQNSPLTIENENGFFHAFHQAYINHGDVKITPDQVWMVIMLYFSKYVDNNAEQLRKAFVHHQGKVQLVVQTEIDKKQTEWNQFFQKVIVQIKEKTVKGVTQHLQCDFSTTNKFYRFFSTATIMNSYKKYFDYTRMICACGIQNIHMGGKLQDWQKLCQKLEYLKNFDVDGQMKTYVKGLLPVLEQFAETYKGKAHVQFWNNIYQERKNPHARIYEPKITLNGWLIKFFTTRDQLYNESVSVEEIDVPIKIINEITKTTKQVHLVGGCKGVSVTEKGVYSPHFSFAIVQKSEKVKGLFDY